MAPALSARLQAIVDALPLRPGMRVLEIGCGPGAMTRALAVRIGDGHVLGIDRSGKAIDQALAGSTDTLATGTLAFRQCAAEHFVLAPGEQPYDLAVAIRVGAFDGRYPEVGMLARAAIKAALVPGGRLYVDGGDTLREEEFRNA